MAGIVLVMQVATGIFLAMHYKADIAMSFDSIQHIMRDVNYGWLLRYMHAVGASAFFFVIFVHMARTLYYGSYRAPRELMWWTGQGVTAVDGDRIHGLFATLGSNVLLGSHGDHQPVPCHAVLW